MDITKNLQLETRRLCKLGVDFRMFEHFEHSDMVGITVRNADDTEENSSRLKKAGYSHDEKAARGNMQVYTISVDELVKIHEKLMHLVELELDRLLLNGVTYCRYDVTSANKYEGESGDNFSISVLYKDISEKEMIDRKLTEIGYKFVGWPQKDMSEFTIPIADLEEIHEFSIAADPE